MPSRGEIWQANLEPTVGHEQGKSRPVLILSVDSFNNGPATLVIVVPITKENRHIPLHVEINPPEGGIRMKSFILCDHLRSISKNRLGNCWGKVSNETIEEVEKRVKVLLAL